MTASPRGSIWSCFSRRRRQDTLGPISMVRELLHLLFSWDGNGNRRDQGWELGIGVNDGNGNVHYQGWELGIGINDGNGNVHHQGWGALRNFSGGRYCLY